MWLKTAVKRTEDNSTVWTSFWIEIVWKQEMRNGPPIQFPATLHYNFKQCVSCHFGNDSLSHQKTFASLAHLKPGSHSGYINNRMWHYIVAPLPGSVAPPIFGFITDLLIPNELKTSNGPLPLNFFCPNSLKLSFAPAVLIPPWALSSIQILCRIFYLTSTTLSRWIFSRADLHATECNNVDAHTGYSDHIYIRIFCKVFGLWVFTHTHHTILCE